MIKISTLHKKWSKTPAYKAAYDSLKSEFSLAEKLIDVRVKSGLSQEQLAQRMGTSQSTIARLESGSALRARFPNRHSTDPTSRPEPTFKFGGK